MSDNTFLLGFLDAFYTVFSVIFVAYLLGSVIDDVFDNLFNSVKDEQKSNVRLVIETAVQIGITTSLCYPFVKIIDNLPFPNNNYRKIKIKDYEQGRIIWSTFVLLFQPNLLRKLNLLKSNMTLFN